MREGVKCGCPVFYFQPKLSAFETASSMAAGSGFDKAAAGH